MNAAREYQARRIAYWDAAARKVDSWNGLGGYYHRRLEEVYRSLVPSGQRVTEIGCGLGDLLAAVEPEFGVGVDFSGEMVSRASERHPYLRIFQGDAHHLPFICTGSDFILLSDLINDLWDVQGVLQQVRKRANPNAKIILNFYSRMWELPLTFAARLGLSASAPGKNWLTLEDVSNLLNLTGFEVIRSWTEIMWPFSTPLIGDLCNKYLVRMWPFNMGALTHLVVARPLPRRHSSFEQPKVSVIVPARNEAGNIANLFSRMPDMGLQTELVFVEGHSEDDTYGTIERNIARHPQYSCQLLPQTGSGKGDAVRLGFSNASGDILIILDGDLTVAPEDLPRFVAPLLSGAAQFVNGVRLVYPMEGEAMRTWNMVGNKFFSMIFSWLIGQFIKDTLCGTKVLWKRDYLRIAANRTYFGDFDPFGDFDLLLGAAKLNLRILDLPVRYRKRTYGTTNIQRWKHGLLLLRMALLAARKIKFV